MKKIFNYYNIINCLNVIILILLFSFILFNLRYAIVIHDDIEDFIKYNFGFYHGRIINELISFFFIIKLPSLLNIPIQNFAFVSEGITKTIFFCILVYLSSFSYNKFRTTPIIFSLILCLSPFLILSILNRTGFIWCFMINQYYTGYVASIIFFLLFWHKLSLLYIKEIKFTKKNFFILTILIFLTAMSNEMLYITAGTLLFLLSIDSIFTKKYFRYFFLLFILTVCTILFIIFLPGTTDLYNEFGLSFKLSLNLELIIAFAKLFFKYILVKNIFLIIPLIVSFSILFFTKKNKEKNNKVIKYILFTLTGFLIFIVGTLLLPLTCYCTTEKYKFWFLHQGLLSTFGICLYCISLYLTGYVFCTITKLNLKILSITIFILSSFLNIHLYYIPFEYTSYNAYKEPRIMMYIIDKITVHYFKQNKTAILPKNLPFEVIRGVDIKILSTDSSIYEKIYTKEQSSYLEYIEKEYGLNVDKGMTFRDNNETMKLYKDSGGVLFTNKELDKLDFLKIKESLNKT